jgi:serine/threonine-protein kinase
MHSERPSSGVSTPASTYHGPRGRGPTVSGYIVHGAVAEGAASRVYEATHVGTGHKVALKVLRQPVAEDPIAVERFRREYETARSLDDSYVVRVLDFGETGEGSYFMAMEFLEGEDLGSLLARKGPAEPSRMVRVLCQLALGLHRAHREGVVHRDLKPSNIFLVEGDGGEDQVRILDFGSVKLQMAHGPKLTALGTTLGSPFYMSPEQAMGKQDVDPRTDVFAMASISYELATGRVAFAGDNVAEILMKIVGEEPPPVSASNHAYPWAFDDVIKRGLRKDKAERFRNTIELADAMLGAFGLEANVARWAIAPTSEIAAALETGPGRAEAESRFSVPQPSSVPALPERRSNVPTAVLWGLAVMAIAALAVSVLNLAW